MSQPTSLPSADVRSRIIAVAARLVSEGGIDAATTRAVADAAAVQAPAIYRLFGDKAGLLDAVAEQALADFVATKSQRKPGRDPVADLRHAWDDHIAFNLAHPSIFLLAAARPGTPTRAAAAGLAVLAERVQRVAAAGRLRVSQKRAVELIHAMGTGVLLAMLAKPNGERTSLSHAARDAVLAAVIADPEPGLGPGPAAAASTLRARLDTASGLSPAEQALLREWLERIAAN